MSVRWWLVALLLLVARPALGEVYIGVQATVDFPGSSGPHIEPPGGLNPIVSNDPLSVTNDASGVAIATAMVTNTGLMASQATIMNANPAAGRYTAESQTVYQMQYTPTTDGPVSITFNVLPQTLQVFEAINSLAQITSSFVILNEQGDVDKAIFQSFDTVQYADGFFSHEFIHSGDSPPPKYSGANGAWHADAFSFSVLYAEALAGVTFTLEYSITTYTYAFFDLENAGLASFQADQVLAQFGDPLTIDENALNVQITPAAIAEVPEPATWLSLLVMGSAATLMGVRLRRAA